MKRYFVCLHFGPAHEDHILLREMPNELFAMAYAGCLNQDTQEHYCVLALSPMDLYRLVPLLCARVYFQDHTIESDDLVFSEKYVERDNFERAVFIEEMQHWAYQTKRPVPTEKRG